MPQRTLNQLIASVIGEAQEAEAGATKTEPDSEKQTTTEPVKTDDVEKLASVLDFLGQRGIENLLKSAMHTPASKAPEGTNEGTMHKGTSGSQVTSTKASPPMKQSGSGSTETNANKPAGGGGAVDTSNTMVGDHHAALASNEAAISASPTIKEKQVASALSKVLDNAGAGNNHQKMKKASDEVETKDHDLEAIRAELARRVASAGGK